MQKPLSTLALLLSLTAAVQAAAQPGASAATEWRPDCHGDRMSDRKTCAAVSVLPLVGQKSEHLALAFFVSKGVLFVSSTVDGKAVAVRVDKNPAIESSLCQEAMCALQSAALLSQMRAGTTMLVRFTPTRGVEIGPEEFTLIGFDAAYRKAVEMQKAK